MDDDEGVLEAVRTCRAARGAALAELVRVIRAHKEVLLQDGALRVECVWGCGGACVVCWAGASGWKAVWACAQGAHSGTIAKR
jgi:predicted metal-binding protein